MKDGRYWDKGINVVEGCSPCSPGCDNCWAASLAHRFSVTGKSYKKDGTKYWPFLTGENGKFNGRIDTHPERLEIFYKTRKPTVFAIWNDLHHENVPWVEKGATYDIMRELTQHKFLILTKRPHILLQYYLDEEETWNPANNIWHGLTVCNQQEADEKIPIFLKIPGKKFLSIEPMLGAIKNIPLVSRKCITCNNPSFYIGNNVYGYNFYKPSIYCKNCGFVMKDIGYIDAVILGAETGAKARPMNPDWARSIRDQCAQAGVPFFLKQLDKKHNRILDGRTHDDLPY